MAKNWKIQSCSARVNTRENSLFLSSVQSDIDTPANIGNSAESTAIPFHCIHFAALYCLWSTKLLEPKTKKKRFLAKDKLWFCQLYTAKRAGGFPFSPLNQANEARTVAVCWLKFINPSFRIPHYSHIRSNKTLALFLERPKLAQPQSLLQLERNYLINQMCVHVVFVECLSVGHWMNRTAAIWSNRNGWMESGESTWQMWLNASKCD